MNLHLPVINASALSRSFILKQARRRVGEVLEGIGQERLRFLIQNNKSLSLYLSREQEAQYRRQAKSYGFIAKVIGEQELWEILPEWVKGVVVEYGDQGRQWVESQVKWLLSFFKEEENAKPRNTVQWRRRDQGGTAHDKVGQPTNPTQS